MSWTICLTRNIIGLIALWGVLYLPEVRAALGDTGGQSRVEHGELSVEFSARCSEHAVQLHGVITNESAEPITIQLGSLPWQYDVLGSEFTADASGTTLKRNTATPILGRLGPITLAPHEQQDGFVPISNLFPDLHNELKKGHIVNVRWRYWTAVKTASSTPFEGLVVIKGDPCK